MAQYAPTKTGRASAVAIRFPLVAFNVDNLTIPYGKWRKESIKAYGNAIVPLIAVKIFEMINKIEGYEQQTTL